MRRILVVVFAISPIMVGYSAEKFADVVKIAPDTYIISRVDRGGVFGNAGKMKTNVMREAQEFAESKGKVAVVRQIQETPMAFGQFASIQYTFWVLDPKDADAKREDLIRGPDSVAEQRLKIEVKENSSQHASEKRDIYAELLKLDDLRKRGILSESEFESQKQKILSQ